MLPVPVPTTRPASREALDAMVEKLDSIFREVRDRAFHAFARRGNQLGTDLEDWLNAERELYRLPESEMSESDTNFEIRAAVPGFRAEDLHVQVLPELIVVEGKNVAGNPEPNRLIFSEFTSKRLFRHYKLSSPIDVGSVQATLDKGMLTVVAVKKEIAGKTLAVEVPLQTKVELAVRPKENALVATAAN